MSAAIRTPRLALLPRAAETAPAPASARAGAPRLSVLDAILAEQQDLTAVERFAHKHDKGHLPGGGKTYRDLIPMTAPAAGQQYAFEVDLDVCTGCKACVTGCHNMNGLDEGEVWRTVGVLHGGTPEAPSQQTVTTSCHHCLEPACLSGCPVKAYEKDPVTGIVKHLDDQCIGCQYCVFMCPYDAPKYSKDRGIVRKCDMCSDRLAHGEAPACVASCPNEAIRITVVDLTAAIQATEASAFLPGAPTPADTLPTTVYKSARVAPRNMLPADFYSTSPEHAHPPLVVMLVLTQLSVGAFVLQFLVQSLMAPAAQAAAEARALGMRGALCALGLAMVAMGASTLHLGRPRYAFRAFLGLRTSWLSREIIGFSLYAGLAAAYAGSFFLPPLLGERLGRFEPLVASLVPALGYAAAGAGIAGVLCSVMVYAATRRQHWRAETTGGKFLLTAVVLGAATVLLVSMATAGATATPSGLPAFVTWGAHQILSELLLGAAAVKMLSELATFLHLRDPHHTVLKRTAILMARDLRSFTLVRFVTGAAGGLVLPTISMLLIRHATQTGTPVSRAALVTLAAASFALCLVGELLERFMFFAAAPASKMPGGVGSGASFGPGARHA
jgi:formate dehydrogenase iron-sulfur subunit